MQLGHKDATPTFRQRGLRELPVSRERLLDAGFFRSLLSRTHNDDTR